MFKNQKYLTRGVLSEIPAVLQITNEIVNLLIQEKARQDEIKILFGIHIQITTM